VVTGGSSGIGLAAVRRPRADGALVFAGDLEPVRGTDMGVTSVIGDLSRRAGCERLVDAAISAHRRLDIVVTTSERRLRGAPWSRSTIPCETNGRWRRRSAKGRLEAPASGSAYDTTHGGAAAALTGTR
jgi:NAD(P)-dependent dehydrogenase (short-subunit alcohol dehydrogenase family)